MTPHRWERIGNYRYRCRRCKVLRLWAVSGWRYCRGETDLPGRPECGTFHMKHREP